MIKNIFVTKYYLKYYDNKECTYYFPTPIYDNNGRIDDELLTLTLNKLVKIINAKEFNLILLDPVSYSLKLKSNETIEDASLYIDSSKYLITNYSEKVIYNMDKNSIEAMRNISADLNIKINLYSYLDFCISNSNGNQIYFIIDKNFYSFIIIKNGIVEKYFYDDRVSYNKRAIENLKVRNEHALESEIYEELDFEIAASSIASITSIINDLSDFTLILSMYNDNDNINGYLSSIGFKSIDTMDVFNQNNFIMNFLLNKKTSKNNTGLKYIFPIILSAILIFEVFSINRMNSNIEALEDQINIESNLMLNEKIVENEKKVDELSSNDVYENFNEVLTSYGYVESNKIFDTIDAISNKYNLIKAYIDDTMLKMIIECPNEIDSEYKEFVTKEIKKNGINNYELTFEVLNDKF